MTRDDVLDEAARLLESIADEMLQSPGLDLAYRRACLRHDAESIRTLKSSPPEKSLEVEGERRRCPDCGNDWMLAGDPVVLSDSEIDALRAERDFLKARLEAQEKRAEEALARVKHIEWEMNGAKMKGER